MKRIQILSTLIAALLPLSVAACAGDAGGDWGGTVDTLASGTVVVNNPADGLWGPDERWVLTEELRIGSAMSEGPDLFAGLTGMVVTDDGAIHVLDRQAKELKRFDAAGEHEWTAGREGGGPGEFRDPIGLALGPDGQLWIADAGNARYATYSQAGDPVTSYPRALGGYSLPWHGGFGADGHFHEQTMISGSDGSRRGLVRMDSLLAPSDTFYFPDYESDSFVLTTERGSMSSTVPFAPSQRQLWDPRGFLWVAITDDYAISKLSLEGDTLMVIRKPAEERARVTEEEKQEAIERLEWFTRQGGRVDPGRIPSVKPIFTDIQVSSDGHLWVRLTPRPEEDGARYDIFDPDGRYLGPVATPSPLYNPVLTSDAIHTIASDSLGVQNVVRWGIGTPAGDQ